MRKRKAVLRVAQSTRKKMNGRLWGGGKGLGGKDKEYKKSKKAKDFSITGV